jgi:hypothetical protein
MVLGKRLNHTHRNSHNESLKKKRKTVKKSKLHPNAKMHNGKNSTARLKTRYNQAHIFPYIADSNLVKHNLWSTSKNMKNTMANARETLLDTKPTNEKKYILTQKFLKRMRNTLSKANLKLAMMHPAKFAHKKAKWIERNVIKGFNA